MNPHEQQSPQPDYGFIMQQPAAPAPRKRNPKVVVLLVLAVITLLIVGLSAFSSQSKKQDADTQADASSVQVVEKYMADVASNDTEKVLASYTKSSTKQQDYIEAYVIKPLAANYELANCAYDYVKEQSTENSSKIHATCPAKKTGKKVTFAFSIVKTADGQKIASSQIVGTK